MNIFVLLSELSTTRVCVCVYHTGVMLLYHGKKDFQDVLWCVKN